MNVNCPTCATGYEIPPLLRPRRLRCASCGAEWRVQPPDVEPEIPAQPEPEPIEPPPPIDALRIPDVRPAPMVAIVPAKAPPLALIVWCVLWALSLLLVAGCLAALWHWRHAIGQHWPPSLRLYRLIPGGIPPGSVPR